MKARICVLSAIAALALGCTKAVDPEEQLDDDDGGDETTSAQDPSTGGETDATDATDSTDSTDSTEGEQPTSGMDTTDGSETTGGPEQPAGFCAVVRGPVMAGDDVSAVYVIDDSFVPQPAVTTSGELFMSPNGSMFAHVVDGAVWVYDIVAGSHTQVSMGVTVVDRPTVIEWSPTGDALMYRVFNDTRSDEAIFLVRSDGSDHVQLVEFGVPFRSGWSEGNLAGALGREVVSGALAKVWVTDMDAATPQPIEVDAISGVDETASRELAPCGDGILAEIGDGPVRDIYRVGPNGGVTVVTDDGMGGNPIGCADDVGASFFSRSGNQLWGLVPDHSADAMQLDGYWGSGATVVSKPDVAGVLDQFYLFYPDETNTPWIMEIAEGTPANAAAMAPLNSELGLIEGTIDDFYAVFTGDFQQTQVHAGGIDEPMAQQVYETQPGEFIGDAFLIDNDLGDAPDPDNALILLLTHPMDGDRLIGVRGNGDLEGESGMLLGGASGNPFECERSSNNFAVCLTEHVDGVKLAAVSRVYTQDGGRGDVMVQSEQVSDETEPFAFGIRACAPIF